jgi:hypothetical protein
LDALENRDPAENGENFPGFGFKHRFSIAPQWKIPEGETQEE